MKQYVAPILRWWWLIALTVIIAAGAAYYAVSRLPPEYEVRATLVIGRSISNPNPNTGDLYLEQQLANLYANVGNREQVAQAAMRVLGLNALPKYFVRPVSNTPLLEIVVSDSDPVRAVAVANELANQLVQYSPTSTNQQDQTRQGFITEQLDKIQDQITITEQEIVDAQNKLGELTSARQIADTQDQITALQQKLVSLQANYANLLTSTLGGSTNSLSIVQPADLPAGPVGPNRILYLVLASALGLTISVAAAFGFEALDDTIKPTDDLAKILPLPVLATIGNIPSKNSNKFTYVADEPRSPIADDFRFLRTNIQFNTGGKPIKTILISSAGPSDGKSTIAFNLAASFAQSGLTVSIMDADLRKPSLQNAYLFDNNGKPNGSAVDLTRTIGLSDLLIKPEDPRQYLFSFCNDRVKALFAGTQPQNPIDLIASDKMDKLIASMTAFTDILIIDGPPLFLADASILASKVEALLLVVRLNSTRKTYIKEMVDQVKRTGIPVIGLVVNHQNRDTYYYEKRYYQNRHSKNIFKKLFGAKRSTPDSVME